MRYTPEQKTAALLQLDTNSGNLALTSLQTHVSVNTLRLWRNIRRLEHHQQQIDLPPQQQQAVTPLEIVQPEPKLLTLSPDSLDTLREIRQHLVRRVLDALEHDDLNSPTRAYAVAYLIDRIIKLDAQLGNSSKPGIIRMVYEDRIVDDETSGNLPQPIPENRPDSQ